MFSLNIRVNILQQFFSPSCKKIIVEEYFKQNKKLRIVSTFFELFQNLIHVV